MMGSLFIKRPRIDLLSRWGGFFMHRPTAGRCVWKLYTSALAQHAHRAGGFLTASLQRVANPDDVLMSTSWDGPCIM